jgi:murein DD-endopeptidase MepM/ murein hydrolase activator NlpD
MAKTKYFFNPASLSYEKVERPLKRRLGRWLILITIAVAYAVLVLFLGSNFFDSPKEKAVKRELAQMQFQYQVLNDRLDQIVEVMDELQDRDDNIYRVIFEAEPIPDAVRKAGYGGVDRYAKLDGYANSDILIKTTQKIDQITSQLVVQSKSFDDVYEMAMKKADFLAAMPAIQPISNKDLKRLSSYFGYRMDPFYKVMKLHEGVDFSAPIGTDIYATGDGVVKVVKNRKRGYGNSILIDHGYGYQTFYAHCHKILVKKGQGVKRGQVIGIVGNTGKSTAPHLHYEVRKNNKAIDPINFFFNDLTPEEYEKVIKMSAQISQSFD